MKLQGIHEISVWKLITKSRGSRIVKSRNARTPCINKRIVLNKIFHWKMENVFVCFLFISVQLHIVWNICFSSWQSFFSSFCVQVTQGCNFNLRVWFHTESLHIITNQFVLGSKLKKSLLLIFDTSTYSTTKSRFLPWAMWVCCLPQYGPKFFWAEPCPSSVI